MNSILKQWIYLTMIIFMCIGISGGFSYQDDFKSYSEYFFYPRKNIEKMTIGNSPREFFELAEDIYRGVKLGTISKLAKQTRPKGNLQATTESLHTTVPPTVSPEPQVSETCQAHMTALLQGLTSNEIWALKMLDAIGKPPANLLGGGFKWLGDYDECLDIQGNSTSTTGVELFGTEYCMISAVNIVPVPPVLPKHSTLNIGMCLPDSCSERDVQIIVNNSLVTQTQGRFWAYKAECQEPEKPFDTRASIVLIVVALFIFVLAIGTTYDVLLIQWPKWEDDKRTNLDAETTFVHSEKTRLITDSVVHEPYQPGLMGKIVLSFSIYTNGSKLLSTAQQAGSLTAVNGIRFISMTWVILGHAYAFILGDVDNVGTFLPKMMKRVTFPAISNALVSVDTFFVLSGTLLVYLVMKELKTKNGRLNWPMFYFHRFWRLTPPYMLVLMVYVSLYPYIGSGPMWKKEGLEKDYCKDSWFYNLLYINNFAKSEDQCFGWAWYLANDMQFFVISPLIILPLYFFPLIGYIVMLAFLTGTWVATGVMATKWDVPMSTFDGGDQTHWWTMYVRPYFRMGPYLAGMLTGYALYKTEVKFKMNKYLAMVCWLIAAVSACAVLYGIYDDVNNGREPRDVSSFYIAVHRTVWGAAVCWVIFACARGYGGFINTILSWKAFIPLSRLTYCAYLVHPIVIYYFRDTRRRLMHLSDIEIIYQFLGHIGLSYAAACIASLAFEAPMMGLEKVVFKKQSSKT